MIPVSLSIQGIYSYQAKQTIDFTKLTSAGIFGIFGPVGSGKSTILEAITFALYGRTDRLNLSGDNRNYNMMNLKSNEMAIEFVFRSGSGGAEYMAVVRSRRNSKQFDDVKACERTAYKKEGEGWIPFGAEQLETVVGLSYENFKRTIIIPQGKFQEFLLLGSKERTLMMKELFNLERFELYYKVASIESKANQQKQNLEGQLMQLGEITREQIASAEDQLKNIQYEIEAKSNELVKKQTDEKQLGHLKELVIKITSFQEKLKNMKEHEPAIAEQENKLAAYEYCTVHFKTLLNVIDTLTANISALTKSVSGDENTLFEISARIQKLETEFEKIRFEYENREVFRQKADELSKVMKIADLEERYQNFLLRISKGEKLVVETTEKIDLQKQNYEKSLMEIKIVREQIPDLARLSKAREWFAIYTGYKKNLDSLESEKVLQSKEIEDLIQQKVALFNTDSFTGISLNESYDQVISLLQEKQQMHQNAIEVLQIEKQHLQVQQKLEEYASGLHDGKPCPLCGSLSHPQKYNAQNIHEGLLQIGKEISVHEKALLQIDRCLKRLTEINTALCLKEDSLARVLLKLEEVAHQQAEHQKLFAWDEIKDENALGGLFEIAERLQNEVAGKEKEIENLRTLIEKESNQKELYTKALVELKNNSTKELTEANTLKGQITLLNIKEYSGKSTEAITLERDGLLNQYKTTEENYHSNFNKLTQLRKEQDTLLGRLNTNKQTLEKERQSFRQANDEMNRLLIQSQYSTTEEVRQILNQNIDLDLERRKISTFRQELDFAAKQIDLIQSELKGETFDENLYLQIQKDVKVLLTELNLKNQEKGEKEASLKKLNADFEAREKLNGEMLKLENRLDDIKTLKQLFKGNGFVKYISSVYLRELIHAANERFYKLSGQKLSLELNAENDFEIRDYLNGGKLRSVKTLSGGQTFQAALSLALALSDNTRQLSGADENFFFLDEGFGSLDKDSLQIVFETLKSLRHENRIVGIISHVEEMNQEIDIHLKVKNNGETGSVIQRSWEHL